MPILGPVKAVAMAPMTARAAPVIVQMFLAASFLVCSTSAVSSLIRASFRLETLLASAVSALTLAQSASILERSFLPKSTAWA